MTAELPKQLDHSFASNLLTKAAGPISTSFNAMMVVSVVLPAFVTMSVAKILGGMNFL